MIDKEPEPKNDRGAVASMLAQFVSEHITVTIYPEERIIILRKENVTEAGLSLEPNVGQDIDIQVMEELFEGAIHPTLN